MVNGEAESYLKSVQPAARDLLSFSTRLRMICFSMRCSQPATLRKRVCDSERLYLGIIDEVLRDPVRPDQDMSRSTASAQV
jgi:hypothetical protein